MEQEDPSKAHHFWQSWTWYGVKQLQKLWDWVKDSFQSGSKESFLTRVVGLLHIPTFLIHLPEYFYIWVYQERKVRLPTIDLFQEGTNS